MNKKSIGCHSSSRLIPSCACYTALALLSVPVMAQNQLEEVLVTAQKREQSLQEVPISISVLDGDFLRDMGVKSGLELARWVPGLVANGSATSDQRYAIRGVGSYVTNLTGAEASVGVFLDNVYSGQSYLAGSNFFDVGSVQVLKGPQGTLFGRNTSAGAIDVTSKKADREQAYLDTRIGFGNEGQQIFEAIGNYSPSPDWGVRVGVQYQERDGTFKNTTNGEELNDVDDLIARIGFQRDWSDRFRSDFKLDYFNSGSRPGATAYDPDRYEQSASVEKVTQQTRDDLDMDVVRASLTLAYDISDTLVFTSITSYLDADMNITTADGDVSPMHIIQYDGPAEHTNYSQEFRLNGSSDTIDWFVGASVFYEENEIDVYARYSDYDIIPALAGIPCGVLPFADLCSENSFEVAQTTNETLSYGLYADATWQATEKLSLTLGGRYSYDEKDPTTNTPFPSSAASILAGGFVFFIPTNEKLKDDESWSDFSPRFVASYAFEDTILGYASVTSGYKAGGFNFSPDNFPFAEQNMQSFDEETVLQYEVGLKSDFADNRARVNVAAFFIDYSDLQYEDVGSIGIPITRTIDEAENYGIEIEASYLPVEGLDLNLAYQYLDSEITKGNAGQKGNPLPYAPEHSVNIRARYQFPIAWGVVGAQVAFSYVDDYFLDPFGDEVYANVPSHETWDIRLDLTSENQKWNIALIGENITDERWFHQYELALVHTGYPNVGELWRAELSYRFE